MKHFSFLLILLLFTFSKVEAQKNCDYIYTRTKIDHLIKWNQFDIDLSSKLLEIKVVGEKTILTIDTSTKKNWIVYNNYSQSNGGPYELIFSDSIFKKKKIRKYIIKDLNNQSSFSFMYSSFAPDYLYIPEFHLLNKVICFYNINKYKKYEIVFVDLGDKKVYKIATNTISGYIGKSDTSIYFRIQNKLAKIGAQKFKQGEFVSISKNGSNIVSVIDDRTTDSNLKFYNKTFSVQEVLLKQETNDCVKTEHYKTYISTNEKLIDSINFQVVDFATNDIPKIDFKLDKLIAQNNDFYKVYYPNGEMNSWDNKYWTNKLEILQKCVDKNYLLIDNKLFVIVQTDLTKHKFIPSGNEYTLNNLIIDKNSTDMQTILMFDISKNEFIGYPTIEYK